VIGRPVPRVDAPRRAGDPPELVAAIDRARDVLGWTPDRSTLDEMIGSAWAFASRRAA
jgi:UDP-glucose 4-epimerase